MRFRLTGRKFQYLALVLAVAGGSLALALVALEILGVGTAGIGTTQTAGITAGLVLIGAGYVVARAESAGLKISDVPLLVGLVALTGLVPLAIHGPRSEPLQAGPNSADARRVNDRILSLERSVLVERRNPTCRPPVGRALPEVRFEQVLEGLSKPVGVATAGDGSGRLFVVEKSGTIRVGIDGDLVQLPFLDIRARVISDDKPPKTELLGANGEQGLLGLAFSPDFETSGTFYVHYNSEPDGRIVVSRFRVSADPNRADAESEEVILEINKYGSGHNAGQLAFGPDGYLYIGAGDGGGERWRGSDASVYGDGAVVYSDGKRVVPPGSGLASNEFIWDDPWESAPNLGRLLGKILRIDVSGQLPYVVPPDNPFIGHEGARTEIWALGFRNPWRFSFDDCDGALFVADVGRSDWEEIDLIEPGGNYGWPVMEGGHCFPLRTVCDPDGLSFPIAEYGHLARDPKGGNVVIGGYVYRGARLPDLTGRYVFADFASTRIWALTPTALSASGWRRDLIGQLEFHPSSFGVDSDGELLIVDYAGRVLRLVPSQVD